MSESTDDVRVLVVDDERDVADVYALRLSDQFETATAYSGEAALEAVDGDVDVVLLDRHMPNVSEDYVLNEIRERNADCRVVVLTAVDPDYEIIDVPFDDYICKPAQKDDLVGTIEHQLLARRYDERLAEFLETTAELASLKAGNADEDSDDERIAELERQAEEIRAEMDEALAEFDDIDVAFQEVGRHPGI